MNTTLATSVTVTHPRPVEQVVTGRVTQDGAGVKLTRVFSQELQHRLDPFLMLDNFGSDKPDEYIAGFPDHPHRGFETVTYMIEGRMRHRDSAGHEGLLNNGDVQWMTAGRGLIHSELPEQEDGRMEGFQLWLNLPAKDKMIPAWYRDIPGRTLPVWQGDGVSARIIAGQTHGVAGSIQRAQTEPLYLDLHLEPGARFEQPLPAHFTAFAYPYRGQVTNLGDDAEVAAGRMAIFAHPADSDGVALINRGTEVARVLLLAGQPLREPIAQYGPFVMNTHEEIFQAVEDYRNGRLG
jgi:quercetin 2,3-dioxygenase